MFHSFPNNVKHNVNDDFKSNLTNTQMLNADDVSDDEGNVLDHLLGSSDEDSDEELDNGGNEELDVGGNDNVPMDGENVVQENEKVASEKEDMEGKEAAEKSSRHHFKQLPWRRYRIMLRRQEI